MIAVSLAAKWYFCSDCSFKAWTETLAFLVMGYPGTSHPVKMHILAANQHCWFLSLLMPRFNFSCSNGVETRRVPLVSSLFQGKITVFASPEENPLDFLGVWNYLNISSYSVFLLLTWDTKATSLGLTFGLERGADLDRSRPVLKLLSVIILVSRNHHKQLSVEYSVTWLQTGF